MDVDKKREWGTGINSKYSKKYFYKVELNRFQIKKMRTQKVPRQQIKFIIGEAGTAKTTSIVKIALELGTDYIATALTHSACNNMIEKGIPADKVKTLHSYFKIMPDTTFINMPKHIPKYLIVDEFSLIPVALLENIFKRFEEHDTTIILSGDLLQLPPVETTEFIKIDNLKLSGCCSLEDAKKIFMTLGRTILNSPYYINANKLILSKNYRCEDNVMKILNNIMANDTVELTDLNKVPEDCVFIASTYKNLKQMRKLRGLNATAVRLFESAAVGSVRPLSSNNMIKTRVGYCNTDTPFILTKSTDTFFNGDIVKVVCFDNESCKIYRLSAPYGRLYEPCGSSKEDKTVIIHKDEYGCFDLLPEQFLTIHYSQGRGFKNVCLCVDDLFEIGMLYTGITRAQKNIYLVSLKHIGVINFNVSDITRPFKMMKMNIYGYIV